MKGGVAERYRRVVERVGEAAARAGRSAADVRIVAVTKTVDPDRVREVVEAGARDLGENYVQEARAKIGAIGRDDLRWHMIGRLQRNKAREAAESFALVHSLDRLGLAEALARAAGARGTVVRCLVEVNSAGEATKAGVAPDEVEPLLRRIGVLAGISIEGLMAIPPPAADAADVRREFARLRELRERLRDLRLPNVRLKELSMGMSADFEVAVEEGATIVRIGTAIFGPRPTRA